MTTTAGRVGALLLLTAVVGCAAPVEDSGAAGAVSQVVGQVGERSFSLEEVDAKAKATDVKAFQAIYDARRTALDGLIEDHLLALEAEDRGIPTAALIDEEITKKTPPVTDADIETFYNQNKAGMRGKPLEQMKGQIQAYLANQGRTRARQTLMNSLRDKHDVRITLEPPRVEVTVAANDPSKGPQGAPVEILEFSDFQ